MKKFFILYSLFSLVITWPLITKFNSTIYSLPEEYVLRADVPYSTPVRNTDAYAMIWELWWRKQAFLRKIPEGFCPLLGIAGRETDAGLFHMPIVTTIGKWLAILKNEVFAYNFLILMSFPLSGLSMCFLVRHLLGVCKARPCKSSNGKAWLCDCDSLAAALAGFIFAFAPLHRRYAFEWLGNAQWHWLPLYVLALLKLDEKKSIKWGFLTGVFFSIAFIENYYFGYFLIFFTLAFLLFRLVQSPKKFLYHLKPYLLAFFTIVILTLPATLPFLRASRQMALGEETELGDFVRDEWQRFALSARPWYYLLPDVNHPVLGDLNTKFYNWISKKPPYFLTQPFYPREHTLYIGFTTLALSIIAVFWAWRQRANESMSQWRQRVWLFLFLGVVMITFSAPPYATISLHKIYFPSHYLYQFFPMFRSYARFGVLVLLCFSILAAFGTKFLLEKIKSRRRCFYAFMFLCFLVSFEFLDVPPFHSVSLKPLPVYQWLAEQSGDFAIIVYPQDLTNSDLLAQRIHQKKFLNPKSRTPLEVREVLIHLDDESAVEKLRQWDVKYLIVRDPQRDPEKDPEYWKDLGFADFSDLVSTMDFEKNYELVRTYNDPRVYLFKVPTKV